VHSQQPKQKKAMTREEIAKMEHQMEATMMHMGLRAIGRSDVFARRAGIAQ